MNKTFATLGRRLRLGLVGGGPGSFIGPVHRTAARLDDNFEIVASVLSSDRRRSVENGIAIGIAPDRAYADADEMFESEASRPDGMEVVAIMTPNDSHYALCVAALDRSLDVICDKPLTNSLEEAVDLVARVRAADRVFCQTFNYTGYPMVRQARAMVRDGDIGEIRMVHLEYVQGYNHALLPGEEAGDAGWRLRPDRVGMSTVLGDIGSHVHHLARFVTDLDFDRVLADVTAVVPGRKTDDTGSVLFRLENGAPGNMWLTQAGAGAVHGLRFNVFGTKGGLQWFEEEPNRLFFARPGEPALTFERGGPGMKPEAARAQRLFMGHPEGFQEAFAVLYADVAEAIVAKRAGLPVPRLAADFPTVEDGARGMKFVAAALESSQSGGWVKAGLAL
jgi:predicted dehydrogenase